MTNNFSTYFFYPFNVDKFNKECVRKKEKYTLPRLRYLKSTTHTRNKVCNNNERKNNSEGKRERKRESRNEQKLLSLARVSLYCE